MALQKKVVALPNPIDSFIQQLTYHLKNDLPYETTHPFYKELKDRIINSNDYICRNIIHTLKQYKTPHASFIFRNYVLEAMFKKHPDLKLEFNKNFRKLPMSQYSKNWYLMDLFSLTHDGALSFSKNIFQIKELEIDKKNDLLIEKIKGLEIADTLSVILDCIHFSPIHLYKKSQHELIAFETDSAPLTNEKPGSLTPKLLKNIIFDFHDFLNITHYRFSESRQRDAYSCLTYSMFDVKLARENKDILSEYYPVEDDITKKYSIPIDKNKGIYTQVEAMCLPLLFQVTGNSEKESNKSHFFATSNGKKINFLIESVLTKHMITFLEEYLDNKKSNLLVKGEAYRPVSNYLNWGLAQLSKTLFVFPLKLFGHKLSLIQGAYDQMINFLSKYATK